MRGFWFEYAGERFEVIFKLITGGRWYTYDSPSDPNTKRRVLIIDYPPVEDLLGDSEFWINEDELRELDPEVSSMLFQKLQMDEPDLGGVYS